MLSLMDRFINFCSPPCGNRITVIFTTIPLMEKELEVIYQILVFSTPDTYVAKAKTKHVFINSLTRYITPIPYVCPWCNG